ncbi:unnamed protein product [Urochloa humidicola]
MVKPEEGGMCSSTVLKVVVEVAVSPIMKASCSSCLEEEDPDLSQEMGQAQCSGAVGECRENELPLSSCTPASARGIKQEMRFQ